MAFLRYLPIFAMCVRWWRAIAIDQSFHEWRLVSHGHVNNSDLLMWINVSTLDWYAFAKLTLPKA
jgi:hypothetical protein